MGRTKHLDPPIKVTLNLRTSVLEKVKQELYSELEDRVPHGAISKLFDRLACDWLREERGRQTNG